MYVDFANWFLVEVFEREVRRADVLLIDEAVPTPDAAVRDEAGISRVTEFAIELAAA